MVPKKYSYLHHAMCQENIVKTHGEMFLYYFSPDLRNYDTWQYKNHMTVYSVQKNH